MPDRQPTYFVSHGGGPWPWMPELEDAYRPLRASFEAMPRELPAAPRAILMVSGHWEEQVFSIMSNPRPGMLYDYGGFPEHTYHIKYPAPGDPALSDRVRTLLSSGGFAANLDHQRAFDHGAFVPLAVAFPKANIPVVQLSIRRDYDPVAHWEIGRTLSPLRDEGVLIIGSGLSYHNLRAMGSSGTQPSRDFDAWLQDSVLLRDPSERRRRVLDWTAAPSARLAHPREDHLIPLMVALGAADQDKAAVCYHQKDFFGGIAASSFRFG